MKFKPIIIVAGEPNSVFSEIFKITKKLKSIILICSVNLFYRQMKALKENQKFNILKLDNIKSGKFELKKLNLIDVGYHQKRF